VVGTDLRNPDFAAYARAFGGFGVAVERTRDFPAAFRAAQTSGLPAIVHLKISADAITPSTTLTRIREQALARG
jgi:acetolactate synthase-1/2/3 large subunit